MIGPEMGADFGFNELARDAYPVARLAHASFHHMAHAVTVLTVSASLSPMRRLYPFKSALKIAVSLRLKDSGDMGSPTK
jgi:hypothetical protein